jgi:hypothetical protein
VARADPCARRRRSGLTSTGTPERELLRAGIVHDRRVTPMCGAVGEPDDGDDSCGNERRRVEQATDLLGTPYRLGSGLTRPVSVRGRCGGRLGSPAALVLIVLLSGT